MCGREPMEAPDDPSERGALAQRLVRAMSAKPAEAMFLITLRHRIWRVTLDGQFFGDYRSKRDAKESADEAARALDRPAKVIEAPIDSAHA